MAFKKADPKQAYVKAAMYGKQGSGKTFTCLLFSEGLAKQTKRRIAYVDTESGTDFYAQKIERAIHPEAFDFDAVYTKSLSEALTEIKSLDFKKYGVVVIDSITHFWDAAKLSYEGKRTKKGGIPLQAWGDIKRAYKELIQLLMNAPAHVFICGREGVEMEDVEGETKVVGTKMKAEGETAYEPNMLINMRQQRVTDATTGLEKGSIVAYFEKDRSGLFNGKSISFPNYKTIEPLVNILSGKEQRSMESDEEVAEKDGHLIDDARSKKEKESMTIRIDAMQTMSNCKTLAELVSVWAAIPHKKMYAADKEFLESLKDEMKDRLAEKELERKPE